MESLLCRDFREVINLSAITVAQIMRGVLFFGVSERSVTFRASESARRKIDVF